MIFVSQWVKKNPTHFLIASRQIGRGFKFDLDLISKTSHPYESIYSLLQVPALEMPTLPSDEQLGTQKRRFILLQVNNLVLQTNQIRQHQSPLPREGKGLIGRSP